MILGISFFVFSGSKFGTIENAKTVTEHIIDSTSEKNILPEIIAINSDEKNKPPVKFRAGHVTQTTLKNYFHETENGYYIQLPSTTLVPTPAIVNGNLLLSGGFGSKQYYNFEAATGKLKWAIDLDDDGPSSPAISEGLVVFNTESCTIFVCDMVTGKMIWSLYLGDPLMSMPTIANGIVFTAYPASYDIESRGKNTNAAIMSLNGVPTHVLAAFDAKTGKILWQKWIDSDIMSAPVAKDDFLYVTTFSGALYKVKQKTGEIIEAKAMRATSVPIFSRDNTLIVSKRSDVAGDSLVTESIVVANGLNKKTLYKKNADYLDKKVQEKTSLKNDAIQMDAGNGLVGGAPLSANTFAAIENIGYSNVSSLQAFQGSRGLYMNGQLYNTMGDEIVCTTPSGDVKWKHKLKGDLKTHGGFMGTPPIYANGHIIVATYEGEILTFNEKGELMKKYEIKNPVRYQPVVDNGWIYVTTANGRLYAINTGNPAITGWQMWGANAARTNSN
jgi:Ca-activated chloride channel family protein